jgi:LCP family protein required for cell wall assembly
MDRRPGAKGSGLTDTLIVVAIEKQTGRVGLISVPRDVAVESPTQGFERINATYGLAYARGENALGALKRTVSELLALPIEHALVVDISVFEQLVDALGGITVDVACPIIDDFVDERTETGRRLLDVKAGTVFMDGPTAAMYVRSRHGRSDFSRARRQQAVLSAIHRELLKIGTLGRLPEIWGIVEHNVATDLKRYELLDLGQRALRLSFTQVHGLVFSDKEVTARFDHGRAMLFPNYDAIDHAVSKLFSAPMPSSNGQQTCPPADVALRPAHRKPNNSADDEPDAGNDDTLRFNHGALAGDSQRAVTTPDRPNRTTKELR